MATAAALSGSGWGLAAKAEDGDSAKVRLRPLSSHSDVSSAYCLPDCGVLLAYVWLILTHYLGEGAGLPEGWAALVPDPVNIYREFRPTILWKMWHSFAQS